VTAQAPSVEARRLNRSFAGRAVVRELDFIAAPGDRLGLAGPNGSGKTTILRCVLGTLAPDSGLVSVGGRAAGSFEARRLVGSALAHDRSLYLRLTGRQNLLLVARIRGASAAGAAQEVEALAEELAIGGFVDKRADRLSTGQLQQVSFARALGGAAPVLVLDEPTRSLDDEGRGRLWAALDRRPHAVVVMATHLDDDLRRCTTVLRLPAEVGG
jgi:ABC-2 type transport system ATP-binding protein